MKRWILLLLLASLTMPGCAMMEDLIFGPEYDAPGYVNGCSAPVLVNSHQTQEPELLTSRR